MTTHSDVMRQLASEDCPECVGTGNFYGNDEDGDYLPCDACGGTGFKKKEKSALELLGEIQGIVKRSNERNYGDGERKF